MPMLMVGKLSYPCHIRGISQTEGGIRGVVGAKAAAIGHRLPIVDGIAATQVMRT
jgi:hypothetical protein